MNIFAGMHLIRSFLPAFLMTLSAFAASAQFNVRDSLRQAYLVNASVAFARPVYQLKERFGDFASIGLATCFKTKQGWIVGLDGGFQFNENVKERDAIASVLTHDKFLIGADGTLYDLLYQMRSFQLSASLCKIIPGTGHNRNSGLYAGVGLGYFSHRIRYEPEERNAPVPQLDHDMSKGYDRLSGGMMVKPVLGYLFLGNRRLVNFFVQIEHLYAQTASLRTYQYDHPGKYQEHRKDGYWAIRLGWTLPIYPKPATEYFAY